jgi:hypothetical protein
MKKFKSKRTVGGIEFNLEISMLTNGATTITTICKYNFVAQGNKHESGFQISGVNYEGIESLKIHLSKVENKIKSISESLNEWKTVSEFLELEGFEILE